MSSRIGGSGETRGATVLFPVSGRGSGIVGASVSAGDATAPPVADGIGAVMSGADAKVLPRRVRRRMKKNASPPTVVSPNDARIPNGARSLSVGWSSGTNSSAASGARGPSLPGRPRGACSRIASHHPSIAVGDGATTAGAIGERSGGELVASAVGDAVGRAVGAAVGVGGGAAGTGAAAAGLGVGGGGGGAGVGVGRGVGAVIVTFEGETFDRVSAFFPLVALNE